MATRDDDNGEEGKPDVVMGIQGPFIDMMGLQIESKAVNVQILDRAIDIAKKDVFWRFLGYKKRLARVRSIYLRLEIMVTPTHGDD